MTRKKVKEATNLKDFSCCSCGSAALGTCRNSFCFYLTQLLERWSWVVAALRRIEAALSCCHHLEESRVSKNNSFLILWELATLTEKIFTSKWQKIMVYWVSRKFLQNTIFFLRCLLPAKTGAEKSLSTKSWRWLSTKFERQPCCQPDFFWWDSLLFCVD